MSNRLHYEKSPYLLQHADNPVDWYAWGEEAFEKARTEDKPVFLSIGYSTCHWCHVMAHESFENVEIAEALNRSFVSIKVDREERPDIDNVYMKACTALTGGGGWPTSLFLTPDKKPFYAGTYFPPKSRYGMTGFAELISVIAEKWETDKASLLDSASQITAFLQSNTQGGGTIDDTLPEKAFRQFTRTYDKTNGGFGNAPKFPTPHNLIFLLLYAKLAGTGSADGKAAVEMAVNTLMQMRKGGIFDHIGGGFSRYSTDEKYLVPHFEKMLYDNALLMIAYTAAYSATGDAVFLDTARRTADFLRREMQSPDGAFYSAFDADSEGGEGKFYVLGYDEVISVLGEDEGRSFNRYYGITPEGNFEGENIPNRLHAQIELPDKFSGSLEKLREYRKARNTLRLDDKILTSWNSLMIAALCALYRTTGDRAYLDGAMQVESFIAEKLTEGDILFVGYRDGMRSGRGFLDEYAFYSAALISLYQVSADKNFLDRAERFCRSADEQFWDGEGGGYFFAGRENEKMIISQKEVYDSAIPSGNSVMAFTLVRLHQLTGDAGWREKADRQLSFLSGQVDYPIGQTMFLLSLLYDKNPPPKITVVCAGDTKQGEIIAKLPVYSDFHIIDKPTGEYRLINGKTAYYVCKENVCMPPVDDLSKVFNG